MTWMGDYRYGSCIIDEQRYAIVKNNDAIERIRAIRDHGNPIIWETGQQMTGLILTIMDKADFSIPKIPTGRKQAPVGQ